MKNNLILIYWSTAIKHWFPDFTREPNDIDYITDDTTLKSNWKEEYYRADFFEYLRTFNEDDTYVTPDLLYTIKLSHLSYDINWDKHMYDVIFLKSKWCKVVYDFYMLLMEWWKTIHWVKKCKLNVKNEEFFKSNIERKYEHDWLHEQYALHWRPMNERIRPDLSSPKCSKELWDKLTYQEKLDCAIEEIYVLTTERFIFVDNPLRLQQAKIKTLKNMIVSTTSGWFNLFLKENFKELLDYKPELILNKIEELKI